MMCGVIVKPPTGVWNSDLFDIQNRAETECTFNVPTSVGIGVTGHVTATGVEVNKCPQPQMVPGTLTCTLYTVAPPVATITAPVNVVEGVNGYRASVPYQDTNYQCQYLWWIDNGIITSGIGTPEITFTSGQVGRPTTLSCQVIHYSDRAIIGTFVANVHPKATVPTIQVPSLIEAPGAVNRTASVTQVGGESYTWTIVGGEITAGKDTRAIQYKVTAADGGVVQLTCTAKDPTGTTSAAAQQSVSVLGPPAVAVTFPKYWPSLSTGAYSFNGGTQMPAEGVRITITETSGGEPRWSGYTGSDGTLKLPLEGSDSAGFLLTESGKTFAVSLRPESRFDLGVGQAVEASVILGRFSDTSIITPPPPGASQIPAWSKTNQSFVMYSVPGGSTIHGLKVLMKPYAAKDTSTAREAGALNMLWNHRKTLEFVASQPGFDRARFDGLQFWWDPYKNNEGNTRFASGNNRIYVRGQRNVNADDFDDGVLLHELGHKVHGGFGPYRGLPSFSPPALGTGHLWGAATDPELAWVEGWANFFQAAVKMSPVYPAGKQTTALFDSGPNGTGPASWIDPLKTPPQQPGWANEVRICRALYLMFNHASIGNGAIGTYLSRLNPGNEMDGFRSFLDRLGSNASAAITTVLTNEGFTNPPPSPMEAPAALTLNAPSAPFRLLQQTAVGNDWMIPREGSAYFACATAARRNLKIQIQGITAIDLTTLGIRIISLPRGAVYTIPGTFQVGQFNNHDTTNNVWDIEFPYTDFWEGPLSVVSVYNRSTGSIINNLKINIIE